MPRAAFEAFAARKHALPLSHFHQNQIMTNKTLYIDAQMQLTVVAASVLRAMMIAVFALAISTFAHAGWFSAPDWPTLKADIRKSHPDVRQMTVPELQKRLVQGESMVLLDVRSSEEFAVSQLKGGVSAPTETAVSKQVETLQKDALIVVYCSVGLRSAVTAQALQKRGYRNVFNLEGSLFEWVNRGLPVYRGDMKIDRVHPFDRKWSELLNASLRAPLN